MPDETCETEPPSEKAMPDSSREPKSSSETSPPDDNCETKPPSEEEKPSDRAFLRDLEEVINSLPDASLDLDGRRSVIQDAASQLRQKWSHEDLSTFSFFFGECTALITFGTSINCLYHFLTNREESKAMAVICLVGLVGLCLSVYSFVSLFRDPAGLKARISASMRGLSDPRRSERKVDVNSLIRLECMEISIKKTLETERLKAKSPETESLQAKAEALQVDFDQLSKTFDSVLESKQMLQAQNSALSVHIEQRADAFTALSTRHNSLQRELQELRKFKASVSTTLHDQTQIKLTLDEAAALKQEALTAKAQITKDLETITQQQAATLKAKDDAIAYAKQMNKDCEQLKTTMQETRRLECQRATKLRELEWDSVKAFEERLKKQEDEEKLKQRQGNHVGGLEGAEVLRGEHNSYAPAFRYASSAPRLGESARPLRVVEERKKEQLALVYAGKEVR